MNLTELREMIMDQMPPETRFSSEDAKVIEKHKDLLVSWQEEIVQGFYNLVFNHPATSSIFHAGERPAREETLRGWWSRVAQGPIDNKFWDWMTYVGLVHIHRKVKNPMMLSVWGFILEMIRTKAYASLPAEEAALLVSAFMRFGQTVTSLVVDSYIKGIAEATGSSLPLLENLASQEVESLLPTLKKTL